MSFRTITSFILAILSISFISNVRAQYVYDTDRTIEVRKNEMIMEFPFLGGLNTPMFSEIDLNLDGTLDLLLFDRVGKRLLPMINKGINNKVEYDYHPEFVEKLPSMNIFLMTADFNCDNKMDVLVGGSDLRLYYNTSSTTELSFDSVNILTFRNVGGTNDIRINPLSANLPGISDVDNDGDLDLLLFGQSEQQINYMKNLSMERTGSCGADFEWRSRCWGQFLESNFNDSIYLDTCRFTFNNEELNGKNYPNLQLKGNKHAGSTLTALDIDGNSSTDLLIGDFGSDRIKLLMNSDSLFPYKNSKIFAADRFFPSYDKSVRGAIFPAAFVIDLDNDSKKDLIFTTNSPTVGNGVLSKNNIQFYKNSESNKFTLNKQVGFNYFFDNMLDFGRGANPVMIDINKDGLLDILIGNSGTLNRSNNSLEGSLAYLKNIGSATTPKFEVIDSNYLNLPSIPLNANINGPSINIKPTAGDIDGDGDDDLLIGDSEGRLHLFKDNSTSGDANFILTEVNFQKIEQGTNVSPTLFDVNNDGLLDLVVGYTPGILSYYKNLGTNSQPIFTIGITSLISKGANRIEITLDNDAADQLDSGQTVRINGAGNVGFGNGTRVVIQSVDPAGNKILGELESNIDSSYNDLNSNATLDPSYYNWGKINYVAKGSNIRNVSPRLYKQEGELNLIIASNTDSLHFYKNIDINADSFIVFDDLYTNILYGDNLGLAIGDLNGDNKVDLVVGNESGGLRYHEALFGIGIEESNQNIIKGSSFELYPNPAKSELNVSLNKGKIQEIRIKDIQGRTFVKSQNVFYSNFTINISNLPEGLYFLEIINTDKEVYVEKLIKSQF